MLTKTHRFISVQIAFVLLVTAFSSMPAHAKVVINEVQTVDGDLDATFGTGGIVTTDFNNAGDFGSSVAIQPDGKIVVAGETAGIGGLNVALARYLPDGSRDATFDGDGKVTSDFGDQSDYGVAVVLQTDGKILLAGSAQNQTSNMYEYILARYNSNGSLDPTFDLDGKVATPFMGFIRAVAVQPDGKIVLVGDNYTSGSDFVLVRYNSNGSLDTGFGTNGFVVTDFGNSESGCAIVIQALDEKIIVAGVSYASGNSYFALARYHSDGSLDATFGVGGKVITSVGTNDNILDLALQPDGKILATGFGEQIGSGRNFVLVRYNSDGSVDTTFDSDGKVTTDFGSNEEGMAVVVQPDGRILLAGTVNNGAKTGLVRYQSDGSLDPGFGVNGKVITDPGFVFAGHDMALQPDHNIIVAGMSASGTGNNDFAVARYIYHAAPATTLTVTKTADRNDGICDADCSLREAIVGSYDGDVIRFDSSLAGKTITLASTLVIDRDLSIDGSDLASKIIVSGDQTVTVFETTPGATAILKSLIVTNGRASGGLYGEGYSGGINNFGTLNIINSTISHNGSGLSEQGNGGGIFNSGSLHITGSIIANNFAHFGGGICNFGDLTIQDTTISDNEGLDVGGILNSGTLTVINTTISNNSSSYEGGGVQNQGIINISNSTISGNKAGYSGGGLSTNGETSIINSTFFNNSAALGGGGIFGHGSLTIVNSTISGNSAGTVGGGIHNMGTLDMTNTILANSTSGSDCYNDASTGVIGVNVKNLMEGNAAAPNHCGTPALSSDPLLGAPASNGGFTQTMALQPGSPAIDAGTNAGCPAKDQRGITRPQGARCDMGAYEAASTFSDVPMSHPYYSDIEILYANGLTGGCQTSPLKFCPDQIMNRGQAAVFMLRGSFGSSYVPPVPTHIFQDDWSKGTWAEPWAEGMKREGLSAGCLTNPLKYCPWDQIPREQAVIFALRMKYGKDYTPPPATGTVFADMTNPGYYATAWAEKAYIDGIIPSCGMSGNKPLFCPKNVVSRGLAACMIVRAKNLMMP